MASHALTGKQFHSPRTPAKTVMARPAVSCLLSFPARALRRAAVAECVIVSALASIPPSLGLPTRFGVFEAVTLCRERAAAPNALPVPFVAQLHLLRVGQWQGRKFVVDFLLADAVGERANPPLESHALSLPFSCAEGVFEAISLGDDRLAADHALAIALIAQLCLALARHRQIGKLVDDFLGHGNGE